MDFFEPEIGGAVVAMKGKKCVAIASDHFHGGSHSVTNTKEKIFSFGDHLYVGIAGLATDTRKVLNVLRFRSNLCETTEGKKMTPKKLTGLLTNIMYAQRFGPYYALPVVAGLDTETWEPFICSTDSIGSNCTGAGYVVAGSCNKEMYGMCEILWEPNLAPADLFELISQTLINSCNQDPLSGQGATVYLIEKHKLTIKTLKTRMD